MQKFPAPIIHLSLVTLFLASCSLSGQKLSIPGPLSQVQTGLSTPSLTPFQPEGFISQQPTLNIPTSTLPGIPTPVPTQGTLWISPAVPEALRSTALGSGMALAAGPAGAGVRLDTALSAGSGSILWIYALVTPFPTTIDDVPFAAIQSAWNGQGIGPFVGHPIWMTASTLAAFSAVWGEPAAGSVSIAEAASMIDLAWAERTAWAIVPFEDLEQRWKVLTVDGQSPVHNDFNPDTYALKVNFILEPAAFPLVLTNRDPQKLTVLAMTGVTAMVRATADRMERKGVLYPGEEVRSVLRSADLTHVSNEIPFYEDCPKPDPWTSSLQFCSDPRYISLLEDVGVDIVELTGNHDMDYGAGPLISTLDMYDQRGWVYYGGGRNLVDASQPVRVTDHGNKLAFIGCNPVGPASDWATNTGPGAAPCDYAKMMTDIAGLRSEGFLPIVTFQYNEYYQPEPTDYERSDFRDMAEAGAVIVSGSQAHVPAAMEFYGSSFIHYGLGNLFFDQMSYELTNGTVIDDTRDVFIDRHIFYDGRYLGTELLTYILEDYARPRLMTSGERLEFLRRIFSAAGW